MSCLRGLFCSMPLSVQRAVGRCARKHGKPHRQREREFEYDIFVKSIAYINPWSWLLKYCQHPFNYVRCTIKYILFRQKWRHAGHAVLICGWCLLLTWWLARAVHFNQIYLIDKIDALASYVQTLSPRTHVVLCPLIFNKWQATGNICHDGYHCELNDHVAYWVVTCANP